MTALASFECPEPTTVADSLPVGGIVPLTTMDFPNRLALVVFTQGCPWRCPYCHNAGFQACTAATPWSWERVCELLEARRGFLDGVVFSGGEPTLHDGLMSALQRVRGMGYQTALHTAGMLPRRLAAVLPLLDWVGLDIKAPFDERYAHLTGDPLSADRVLESLNLLQRSRVPFQLRTTVGPGALGEADFLEVQAHLRAMHAPAAVRQDVRLSDA